ncbi:MAG: CBS domain-containing protein [Burkholderiales bacterium]|nr:CBS domain-containing protein [Burkholderiales bacterium]
MNLLSIANRTVAIALPETPVSAAAQMMRERHVGALVLMSSKREDAIPVGLVTDRDLVVEILAQEVDPEMVTIGDITLGRLVTAHMDDTLFEGMAQMSTEGVRRLVIVDDLGALVGLVAMDDIIVALSGALSVLAKAIQTEIGTERRERSA